MNSDKMPCLLHRRWYMSKVPVS